MNIDYDHSLNIHTNDGPCEALPILLKECIPASLLDVGCGTGTWLKAAANLGIKDIFGVDAVDTEAKSGGILRGRFLQKDLTSPWHLGRKFDVVICLEVGEHLDPDHASVLVEMLTNHSDWIVFSAACPGQAGQHHVNCQWPAWWQSLFNSRGYVCSDKSRWEIWGRQNIEPWYRQNVFSAKLDPALAGKEPRIVSVVHPEIAEYMRCIPATAYFDQHAAEIMGGRLPINWYPKALFKAFVTKLSNRLRQTNA